MSSEAKVCDQKHRTQPTTSIGATTTAGAAAGWTKNITLLYVYHDGLFPLISCIKTMYFDWSVPRTLVHYSLMCIVICWVCHIYTYHSDKPQIKSHTTS